MINPTDTNRPKTHKIAKPQKHLWTQHQPKLIRHRVACGFAEVSESATVHRRGPIQAVSHRVVGFEVAAGVHH